MENLLWLWNVLYMKCPIYEMSFYEMSQRQKMFQNDDISI